MRTIEAEEESLLMNDHIFLVKQRLSLQLVELLGQCADSLKSDLHHHPGDIPAEVRESTPKISKGENYLGRPWTILDYPRVFTRNDMFAFRTLCWWGQGFSMTLLLKGRYLERFLAPVVQNAQHFADSGFHLGISDDPFIHHFDEDNLLSLINREDPGRLIAEQAGHSGFLKLVKLLPINQHSQLIVETVKTWTEIREKL